MRWRESMNSKIVIDLDNTIAFTTNDGDYANALPNIALVDKLKYYQSIGYIICIHTARNMRTFSGNIGLINANTLPSIIEWLKKHHVPYDEIIVGKPWCGEKGFYVDDKAIRPNEFIQFSENKIFELLK